jgi:hypothetical protein
MDSRLRRFVVGRRGRQMKPAIQLNRKCSVDQAVA